MRPPSDTKSSVIKAVLAHGKGDAVNGGLSASELFEARRKLMEHWSSFATGKRQRNVRVKAPRPR
jgi:hypothetical protein